MGRELNYSNLKERQRAERDEWPTALALRVHRALSWLDRAEQCEDADGQFIFLWIAFNAAYANDIGDRDRDPEQLDTGNVLCDLIWDESSSSSHRLAEHDKDSRTYFQDV